MDLGLAPILTPLAVLLLGGVGYLLRRKISGQIHIEDQESIERAIRLKNLLDNEGITLEEARILRDDFKHAKGGFLKSEAEAVARKIKEADEREKDKATRPDESIPFEDTTVGMAIRAQAELGVLEASLEQAVIEFEFDCSEARKKALRLAQEAWLEFRERDAELTSLFAEGGTMASLLFLGHKISLTEERIREIRLLQADANL